MYKFKMKLLYDEEKMFWTKTELLHFKLAFLFAKLGMVETRLVLNGLTF